MAEKFRFKRRQEQEDVSRNLDNNSYHAGPYHTIRQPQERTAYDPWADWFNAGLDPEPFADQFQVEPEDSNAPLFFDESADLGAPWFAPQEQQQYQTEPHTPPVQQDQEYPVEHHYDGYQGHGVQFYDYQGYADQGYTGQVYADQREHFQENQDQRPVAEEKIPDFIDNNSSLSEGEPPIGAKLDEEESQEEMAVYLPNEEQRQGETMQIGEKINPEAVKLFEREKSLKNQQELTALNNGEPLVWKDFPTKSC
ncbi:MAG: hypothetical protein GX770_08800 [Firmicutes bacterium]|nr:hypothetical protein [Bacillota bacterium]